MTASYMREHSVTGPFHLAVTRLVTRQAQRLCGCRAEPAKSPANIYPMLCPEQSLSQHCWLADNTTGGGVYNPISNDCSNHLHNSTVSTATIRLSRGHWRGTPHD